MAVVPSNDDNSAPPGMSSFVIQPGPMHAFLPQMPLRPGDH
jgi:hypothetical protein